MDLSRRDVFHPCSKDSSGDKVNFVLLAKKKNKPFFIWNRPPLPFLGYIYLPVQYGYCKTFCPQLTDLHYPVGY